MYAISSSGYRAITSSDEALPGETVSDIVPSATLSVLFCAQVRSRRDTLLRSCDWVVGSDAPLTSDQVATWETYRQALRDLPAQTGFPTQVTWPNLPNK